MKIELSKVLILAEVVCIHFSLKHFGVTSYWERKLTPLYNPVLSRNVIKNLGILKISKSGSNLIFFFFCWLFSLNSYWDNSFSLLANFCIYFLFLCFIKKGKFILVKSIQLNMDFIFIFYYHILLSLTFSF